MSSNIDDILIMNGIIRKQIESILPLINSEIDIIIKKNDRTVKRIEETLDTLLNYMYLGTGESEFKKLNEYYRSFNKENADIYNELYQELMLE